MIAINCTSPMLIKKGETFFKRLYWRVVTMVERKPCALKTEDLYVSRTLESPCAELIVFGVGRLVFLDTVRFRNSQGHWSPAKLLDQ